MATVAKRREMSCPRKEDHEIHFVRCLTYPPNSFTLADGLRLSQESVAQRSRPWQGHRVAVVSWSARFWSMNRQMSQRLCKLNGSDVLATLRSPSRKSMQVSAALQPPFLNLWMPRLSREVRSWSRQMSGPQCEVCWVFHQRGVQSEGGAVEGGSII